MSNDNPQKAGGLWARLFGMERDPFADEAKPEESPYDEVLPEPPLVHPLPDPFAPLAPLAEPVLPVALPVDPAMVVESIPLAPADRSCLSPVAPIAPAIVAPAASRCRTLTCQSCGEKRKKGLIFCDECGFLYPPPGSEPAKPTVAAPVAEEVDRRSRR